MIRATNAENRRAVGAPGRRLEPAMMQISLANKHRLLGDYFDGMMKIKEIAEKYGLKRPSHVSVIVKRMVKPNRYRKPQMLARRIGARMVGVNDNGPA